MRTLILGAAPDSSLDELYVYAGPWCFAMSPERLDQPLPFPPEPFADPQALETAAIQGRQLVSLAAAHLAQKLNAHHNVKLSAAFWDTALAPWLSFVAEILVDRLWRLESLIRLHGDEPLRVPLPGRTGIAFTTTNDFLLRGALNIHWNHWLFARLLENLLPAAWKPESLLPVEAATPPAPAASESTLRTLLRRAVFALPFPRIKGLELKDSLRLSLTLMGNKNRTDRTLPLSEFAAEAAEKNVPPLPLGNGVLFPIIEELLPKSLLDPLPAPWPNICRTRVAAVAAADDDRLRLKLAWHCEQGGRLIHIQHGGEYGYVRSSVAYSVAEYRQHAFVTWGWACPEDSLQHSPPRHGELPGGACHATPLPHPQLDMLRSKHAEQSPTLLFVGTEMALIPYNLKSTRRTVQHLEYRADKNRFLSALPQNLREKTLYRPYFDLPCTLPDASWLLPKYPEISRCTGPLEPHFLACRLLVLDHLGTTLAQALAAQTPLVIFHNPVHQPVSEDAEELLFLLTEAGILFTSPTAAAAHCAAVWDDIPAWWNKPQTRKARDAFARRHALTTEGPVLPLWKHFLRTI